MRKLMCIHRGVIAEKADTDLFVIDNAGDATIAKEYRKKNKPLRADEIIKARSAIPAVDNRKRIANVTDGILPPNAKKARGNAVSNRELQRLKGIAYGGNNAPKDVVRRPESALYDPWAEAEVVPEDERFSYLEPVKPVKEPRTLKHVPISLAANGKEIPAISVPQPGKSYNPVFSDWDKLLREEGDKEVEAERERLILAEEELRTLERAAVIDPEVLSDGEYDDAIAEGNVSGNEGETFSAKRPERKTQAQRNKIKRRKDAERRAKHEANLKTRALQEAEIKKIAKAVEEKELTRARIFELTEAKAKAEVEVGDERNLRRKPLGKR
jgi:nucleolar protein 53